MLRPYGLIRTYPSLPLTLCSARCLKDGIALPLSPAFHTLLPLSQR